MESMMRRILMLGFLLVALAGLTTSARADSPGMIVAPGSNYLVYADVTVDSSCEAVLPANINTRLFAVVCNSGAANAARCGSSKATATLGTPLSPNNACATLPTSAAIFCCSSSGTTIAPAEIAR
jgi:hypothetical protein